MAKVAFILSGCGYLDGSEIHESVLSLLALHQAGHEVHCFAPQMAQKRVVNHLTGKVEPHETRDVLKESARIARGRVAPLGELKAEAFDAIMLPGGFGAALNLSDFAENQDSYSVLPKLQEILLAFFKAKKPILATCISPVILAKVFENKKKIKLTLGSDPEWLSFLQKLGMEGEIKEASEATFDEEAKVYTTPCYMEPENLSALYEGICAIVAKIP